MRWRSKTHTFHMPQGEVIVMVVDVAMIIGLPTKGTPVTGLSGTRNLIHVISLLYGRTATIIDLRGASFKTSLLDLHFTNVNDFIHYEEELVRFMQMWVWARSLTIALNIISALPYYNDSTPVRVRWIGHKTIFYNLSKYRMTEHQT
ncbi:protein MAIN-LIKE 2-like [Gastrolobium bilobum]|uniref:protein MAIN-LIKE 2-like n=1 Tax=Gastrolobium bilobum TaxID=150636 RepID=UPI002AB0C24E|nr:protein MAIN-LIKE 2-like [Gastrolobium bilobum]